MLIDFPRIKVKVNKKFLSNDEVDGWEYGYIFGLTLLESRPLFFSVHLESGALFSRLPLEAIRHLYSEDDDVAPNNLLDTWGAISSSGNVIQHRYLQDYMVRVRLNGDNYEGMYWATVDYDYGGFAHDPEQHKTSNIVLLDSGQICAAPNNFCLFTDGHFTDVPEKFIYRRNQKYFTVD